MVDVCALLDESMSDPVYRTVEGRMNTATDNSGYVQATVAPGGRLYALYVSPHAMYDLTADQLAAACIEAVTKAQSRENHPGSDRRLDVDPIQP
jgi:hypothetical protein